MKRRLSVVLVLVFFVQLFAGGAAALAKTSRTQAEATAWARGRVGQKPVDMDGVYGAQCVDFIQEYYRYLGVQGGGGNACAYARNTLPAGFTRIQDSLNFVPSPGDIAVWTVGYGGDANGHVAVVLSADLNGLTVADVWGSEAYQNGQLVHRSTWSYNGSGMVFWGVIRPGFSSASQQTAAVEEGTYLLKNGGRCATAAGDYNWAVFTAAAPENSNFQKFKVYKNGAGYNFAVAGSPSGRVLNVSTNAGSRDGDGVIVWDRTDDGSQVWKLEKQGSGYLLHPADNWGLSLTAKDGGSLTVAATKKTENQIWVLEPAKEPVPVTGVALDRSSLTMQKGQTAALRAAVLPGDADDKRLSWRSSAPSVAEVDGQGVVTAVGAGTAVIRVTTQDGKFWDECAVSVSGGKLPFGDVDMDAWYYDAVCYAYESGLMGGTAAGVFSPEVGMNRAMTATVLYRLMGEPAVSGGLKFSDCSPTDYYGRAVLWAEANGIVTGVGDGKFNPGGEVTREQLAVMLLRLHRYAQHVYAHYDTGSLSGFTDHKSISGYAYEAMAWAAGSGVVTGKGGGRADPKGSATRAEVAAMVCRFCRYVAENDWPVNLMPVR